MRLHSVAHASEPRRLFLKALAGGCGVAPWIASCSSAPHAVQTSLGPAPGGSLGQTLMSEQLVPCGIPAQFRHDTVGFVLNLLRDAQRVGIDTIVDVSPARDIALYKQVLQQSSIRVVLSTGGRVCAEPASAADDEEWFANMQRDVAGGIDGTGLKAGIVNLTARNDELAHPEEAQFRAAGRLNRSNGTPIVVSAPPAVRRHLDLLVSNGASPEQCCFSNIEKETGWQGRSLGQQAEYLLSAAREGAYLLFTEFGRPFSTPWPVMTLLLRLLCDQGVSSRILISLNCSWNWVHGAPAFADTAEHPEVSGRNYAYMITDAVPALLKAGFGAPEIRTFLVENPRRFFQPQRTA
jgi:phosphotriesterase-related protein